MSVTWEDAGSRRAGETRPGRTEHTGPWPTTRPPAPSGTRRHGTVRRGVGAASHRADGHDRDDADGDLLRRARSGDRDAVADLWARHYPATLSQARRAARASEDPHDLAAEAFTKMLSAIAAGGGPATSVPGYLSTTMRNAAINRARRADSTTVTVAEPGQLQDLLSPAVDVVAARAELTLVRQAFRALPRRWQVVLWRTAVDGDSNVRVARDLDLQPNALAALARRARAGFRREYLRAHLSSGAVSRACEPYMEALVSIALGSSRVPAAVEHVAACPRCQERVGELSLI